MQNPFDRTVGAVPKEIYPLNDIYYFQNLFQNE